MSENPERDTQRGPWRVLDGLSTARMPPHSLEAERHLLGVCLIDGAETIGRCLEAKLSPKAFYSQANGSIFEVMADLYRTRPPVDVVMLVEELRTRRQLEAIGGLAYVMDIAGGIPTTAQAGYFIEKVREQWLLRELVNESRETIEDAHTYTGGLAELLETKSMKLARMLDYARADQETSEKKAASGLARSLAKVAGQVDRTRWLHTGLPMFDKAFGPFDVREEDWFVLVAALQSNGKSSLARQIAGHNLGQGKKGLVFLLETSIAKWLELGAASSARVNARILDRLPVDFQERFTAELKRWHSWVNQCLWIHDEILPVEIITSRIEDHCRRFGRPDFVVVDHMHLLRSRQKFRAREPEVGYIAKELKRCLKRVDVTGFVLGQLNRSSKTDGNRRPTSSDVRDSGEVEQAADDVILIHTPEKDMRDTEQTKSQQRVMVEIIRDKSRNGPTGHREFWFDRHHTLFSDVHDSEFSASSGPRPGGSPPTKGQFRG